MAGVQIVLTSKIKRWIPTVLNSPHLPEDAEKRLRELYISAETDSSNNSKFIPFSLVKSLYECLQKDQGEVYSFHWCGLNPGRINPAETSRPNKFGGDSRLSSKSKPDF